MNLSKLLGRKLKDDDVIDVLEAFSIEDVVYEFDRLHENQPDVYWAGTQPNGFLLRFRLAMWSFVTFKKLRGSVR